MSFLRLFKIIDSTWVGRFIEKKKDIILNTDPDRIYVENIRSFFGCSHRLAKLFCEMAVKDGYFIKKIGIECPNQECGRIVKSFNVDDIIPEHMECETCKILDREYSFTVSDGNKIVYYKLNKDRG